MSTYNHDPIVVGESNSPSTINTRLSALDAAIGNRANIGTDASLAAWLGALGSDGVSGGNVAAKLAYLLAQIEAVSTESTDNAEVIAGRNGGNTDGSVAALAARIAQLGQDGYHPMAYGAAGDGATDDRDALNTLVNTTMAGGGGWVPINRTYKISSAMTFPDNVELRFTRNGKLSIDENVTVTINSLITAPPVHIFDGDGVVDFESGVMSRFYPEWWGAVGDASNNNPTPTDDTAALQAMLDATPRGSDYIIEKMFATTGITLGAVAYSGVSPVRNDDCSFTGKNKARTKTDPQTRYVSGFCALKDNQDYIIKVGNTSIGQTVGVQFKDLHFWGNDRLINVAMLWLSHLSQGSVQSCTFAFSKGPAMRWDKLEDATITDCNFWNIGSNATPGCILIDHRSGDVYGSNLVRVHNCRFEQFVGGAFRTTSIGKATVVHISLCKFEISQPSIYETTTTSDTKDNAVFQLRVPDIDSTVNITHWRVSDCQFTNIGSNDFHNKLIWVTAGESFTFESNTITMTDVAGVVWFHLEHVDGHTQTWRNFVFRNNMLRNSSFTHHNWDVTPPTINNESKYSIVYEFPRYAGRTWSYVERPDNPITQFISVHDLAALDIFVKDPAGDSLDIRQTVIARSGSNTATFCNLYGLNPGWYGLGPRLGDLTIEIRVRAKVANDSLPGTIRLADTSTKATVAITSESWAWYTLTAGINLSTLSQPLVVTNATSTHADQTIYIDGFTIRPITPA